MQFGPDLIYECPSCKATARLTRLESRYIPSDARWWTDGYKEAPTFTQEPAITECSGCGDVYWLSDAKVVAEFYLEDEMLDDSLSKDNRFANAKEAAEVKYYSDGSLLEDDGAFALLSGATRIDGTTEEMLLKALSTNVAENKDQELYLRLRLWWASNDQFRNTPEASGWYRGRNEFTREKMDSLLDDLHEWENEMDLLRNRLELWLEEQSGEFADLMRGGHELLIRLSDEENRKDREDLLKSEFVKEQDRIRRGEALYKPMGLIDYAFLNLVPHLPKDNDIGDSAHPGPKTRTDALRDFLEREGLLNSDPPFPERLAEAKRNLERLMELLTLDDPDERMMKAEVARELGRFDEAISFLEFDFSEDYEYTADYIRKLAEKGDSIVREFEN